MRRRVERGRGGGGGKIGVVETAAEVFKKRAGKAKEDGLIKFLQNAPHVPPVAEDEIR